MKKTIACDRPIQKLLTVCRTSTYFNISKQLLWIPIKVFIRLCEMFYCIKKLGNAQFYFKNKKKLLDSQILAFP